MNINTNTNMNTNTHTFIERVKKAITELQQGNMIILTDDPERENEGDLIAAAEKITPDNINFMIRHGSGIICLPMMVAQLKKLNLPLMVSPQENTSQRGTPFTVSIEAREGTTTGVSAADRAHTILTAIQENAQAHDIVKPGHVFPLQAKEGGVLERQGHTEGSIDLMRIAQLQPAAVLCEVMNPDGTMARGKQLTQFAELHQLHVLSVDDVMQYRLYHENLIAEEVSAILPLEHYGTFQVTVVKEKFTGHEHVVLKKENKNATAAATTTSLVRIHSSCITGDLFGSKRCDCRDQLDYSLRRIAEEGGILIYLAQEGRGIGLFNKIKTYALQEQGLDTVEANRQIGMPVDSRQYYIAANILKNLQISHVRLLTNNPSKIQDLEKYGIAKVEREEIPIFCNEHNQHYLETKKNKLHHIITQLTG